MKTLIGTLIVLFTITFCYTASQAFTSTKQLSSVAAQLTGVKALNVRK